MADSTYGAADLAATWRALFAEHDPGKESIASACARCGVSPGSWYYWRRKLRGDTPRRKARPQREGRQRAGCKRMPGRRAARKKPAFAELIVREEPPAAARLIEFVLAGGVVVRVGNEVSEAALALVLRVLRAAEVPPC